jgi:hypothetical protein
MYAPNIRKIALTPRHHGALFLKFFKIGILKLQIFVKKYIDVANYVYYDHANFYCQIPCIVGSVKKIN